MLMNRVFAIALLFLLTGNQLLNAAPQDRPADITRWAPESCDLCLVWTGEIKADPNGADFERWLAQPEIIDGIQAVRELIEVTGGGDDGEREQSIKLALLIQQLALQQPWILYLEKLEFDNPKTRFAVKLGEQTEEFKKLFAAFESETRPENGTLDDRRQRFQTRIS